MGKLECLCGHHTSTGNRAIVAEVPAMDTASRFTPVVIHRSVLTAHHPFALGGALSAKKFGPWAV